MAITRWQPFTDIERWEPLGWGAWGEIQQMQRWMNRLFDRLNLHSPALNFMPAAELKETDDTIFLNLEVPGLDAKDLDVKVSENSVEIRGERRSETQTENRGMSRSEFHYGTFDRLIPLPTQIQINKTNAEYRNGILNLVLPKKAEEQRRTVKVSVS